MYVPHIHNRHFTKEQIEELKQEIRKTEYEKAREPLQQELLQAHNEIFELRRRLNIMQDAFKMLVTGIKDDYIDVVVDATIPEARFFTGKRDIANIDYTTVKMIKVPLKENLMRDLARIYNQIEGEDNERI